MMNRLINFDVYSLFVVHMDVVYKADNFKMYVFSLELSIQFKF